jgi:hypothetical protein
MSPCKPSTSESERDKLIIEVIDFSYKLYSRGVLEPTNLVYVHVIAIPQGSRRTEMVHVNSSTILGTALSHENCYAAE